MALDSFVVNSVVVLCCVSGDQRGETKHEKLQQAGRAHHTRTIANLQLGKGTVEGGADAAGNGKEDPLRPCAPSRSRRGLGSGGWVDGHLGCVWLLDSRDCVGGWFTALSDHCEISPKFISKKINKLGARRVVCSLLPRPSAG